MSVDEKHFKSRGKARWVCMASCYILASDHWPDKLNYNVTLLMAKIVGRLRGPPLLLLRHKLRGYKTWYKNTMKSEPPATMHVPDAAVNSIRNNQHEHHNGDGERRKKGSHGFNSMPGLFVLD